MRPPHNFSTRRRRLAPERGFTLLEVLVAFVIAALAIGVMMDGVVSGLRAAGTAAHTQQAVSLAQSRLAAAAAAILAGPPPQNEQTGEDNGFVWRVHMTPTQSAALPRQEGLAPGINPHPAVATLYAIEVDVTWTQDGGTRKLRLDGAQVRMMSTPAGTAL